jgi:hypothetical protein
MSYSPGFTRRLIDAQHEADLAYWARLLDESPNEVRRAVCAAGREPGAVRDYLATRQLALFDTAAAEVAARLAADVSR